MSLRAQQLQETADRQIAELAERCRLRASQVSPGPAPAAKSSATALGAVAAHTTDNYHRIARFVAAIRDGGEQHRPGQHGEGCRASEVELDVLLVRLAAARDALATIG